MSAVRVISLLLVAVVAGACGSSHVAVDVSESLPPAVPAPTDADPPSAVSPADSAQSESDLCQRLQLMELIEGELAAAGLEMETFVTSAIASGIEPDLDEFLALANSTGEAYLEGWENLRSAYRLGEEAAPPDLAEHIRGRAEFMGALLTSMGAAMRDAESAEDASNLYLSTGTPDVVANAERMEASEVAINEFAEQECGFTYTISS